jgi:hypothetical protein
MQELLAQLGTALLVLAIGAGAVIVQSVLLRLAVGPHLDGKKGKGALRMGE